MIEGKARNVEVHVVSSLHRANNFNLLRMIAATAVLISHAYPLTLGAGAIEPLEDSLRMPLGTLAVCSFFVISGYFISQSFERKQDILEFFAARILRIYPALLAALLITVFFLGPSFTKLRLDAYFLQPKTLLYVPWNLTLLKLQDELPGVFEGNPYPQAINGSLWTLVYEAGCYAIVVGVGICGLTTTARRFTAFLIAYCLVYTTVAALHLHHLRLLLIHQLTLPFVIGMAFFQYRRFLSFRLYVLVPMSILTFFSKEYPWFTEVFIFTWCYGLFYVGFLTFIPLLWYNSLGDYSYGMYIYAFPIEQIFARLLPERAPISLMAWAFPPTLVLAVASWHLIERRANAKRGDMTAFLKRACAVGVSYPRQP
jgi:peptidoglycan/LPS O-acetylase OafA/YrhL